MGKTNLRNFISGLFLLTFSNLTFAQQNIQPVKKGESVPDVSLTLHTGDSISSAHLSDYKGKLVILDFWGVHCPDCIEAMPHMLALQHQFKDKIQIIVVATDKESDVANLFQKLKGHASNDIIFAGSHLPFVMDDSILYKMFPHNGVPNHVWIDGDGIFRHSTYENSTTEPNIEAFIEGKKVKLAEAYQNRINEQSPLTWLGGSTDADENVPDYSFFMNRLSNTSDIVGSVYIDRDSTTNKVVGIAISNKRIVDLYKEVFALELGVRNVWSDKIVLDVRDRSKYVWPSDETRTFSWADSNTYCYAIKVPLPESDKVVGQMYKDLDRFFHLQSGMEKRSVKCLVLKRISTDDRLAIEEKDMKDGISIDVNNKSWYTMKNEQMSELFRRVSSVVYFSDEFTPVFDETHYTGKVNITIPFSEGAYGVTVEQMRETLRKYGLDLVEEYRTLNMLVIKDAPTAISKEMARK